MATAPAAATLHAGLVAVFKMDPQVQVLGIDLDAPFADDSC